MIRPPPLPTRTDTPCPYPTRVRSGKRSLRIGAIMQGEAASTESGSAGRLTTVWKEIPESPTASWMHPRPFPCAGGAFLCASTAGHCNFTLRKHCFSCVKLSFVRVRLHLVEKIVVGRQQRAPVESEKRRVCNAPNQNGRRRSKARREGKERVS